MATNTGFGFLVIGWLFTLLVVVELMIMHFYGENILRPLPLIQLAAAMTPAVIGLVIICAG